MREIKIFIIVAIVIGVMYWGVEPLAHSVMHPKTAHADYEFKDLDRLGSFDIKSGDAAAGKILAADNCTSCHSINSEGVQSPFDNKSAYESFMVVPPDLSNIGLIFDSKYLAHFIKDPVRATLLHNKFQVDCSITTGLDAKNCESFNADKPAYPMPSFSYLSDSDISNIVAYFVSIAPKKLSGKEVFLESCNRCHGVDYDKGQYDAYFAKQVDKDVASSYGHGLASLTPDDFMKNYMGAVAPDLSMMIRSKGRDGLEHLINNPQGVPLIDIQNAILNKLLNDSRAKDIAELKKDSSLSKEDLKIKEDEINARDLSYYKISLPANTLKDEWQGDDDYTNMAISMNVMPIGKSMPRVGLTKQAQDQAINYLEKVGDSKKSERETFGLYAIAFSLILAFVAYLWKLKIWRDLH